MWALDTLTEKDPEIYTRILPYTSDGVAYFNAKAGAEKATNALQSDQLITAALTLFNNTAEDTPTQPITALYYATKSKTSEENENIQLLKVKGQIWTISLPTICSINEWH